MGTIMKIRNSIIVSCDGSECTFANGDVISFADDEINTSESTQFGFAMSFDLYDAKSQNTWCGYEVMQTWSGGIYPLSWYKMNEHGNITECDFYRYEKLAQMPMYPDNISFWHTIYDAIQNMD